MTADELITAYVMPALENELREIAAYSARRTLDGGRAGKLAKLGRLVVSIRDSDARAKEGKGKGIDYGSMSPAELEATFTELCRKHFGKELSRAELISLRGGGN